MTVKITKTGMSTMRTTVRTFAAFSTGTFFNRTEPTLTTGDDSGEHRHRLCNQIDTFCAKHLGLNEIAGLEAHAPFKHRRADDLRRLVSRSALDGVAVYEVHQHVDQGAIRSSLRCEHNSSANERTLLYRRFTVAGETLRSIVAASVPSSSE
jgi:hypothetical protein